VRDIGADLIARKTVRPLAGLTIAPYYGCQCLRPYAVFDDPEAPRSMGPILKAAGATVHDWRMGGKCCGASHMNTKMAVGVVLVRAILSQAVGSDAVVTVCPMCQMNLEAYQGKISKLSGENLAVSVLYLPQLLGLALGLSEQEVRLDLNLAVTADFRRKLRLLEPVAA
jgi:heterodisulfide reductase subunit B